MLTKKKACGSCGSGELQIEQYAATSVEQSDKRTATVKLKTTFILDNRRFMPNELLELTFSTIRAMQAIVEDPVIFLNADEEELFNADYR